MGISLKNAVLSSLALVEVVAAAGLAGFVLADDTLVPVSTAVSPRVAYDVTKQGDALVVVVAVEPFSSAASPQEPAGGVAVQLGAAADKKVVLTGEKPTQDADGSVRFTFRIPAERLVTSPAGWETRQAPWRRRQRLRHGGPRDCPGAVDISGIPCAAGKLSTKARLNGACCAGGIYGQVGVYIVGKRREAQLPEKQDEKEGSAAGR